jgi:folate-binding protein YgfZ
MTTADPWALPPLPLTLVLPLWRLPLLGPDALRVLHGQTTQALLDLAPGQRRPTCCVSATARLRALAEVEATAEGALLDVEAGDAEAVRQALDRVLFPADRVTLGSLERLDLMVELLPADDPAASDDFWGLRARRWRRRPGGDPGQSADPVLLAWLRCRQGIPAVPGELNADHNPFELGLDNRVSLSKGCYLGQETLAKLQSRDGVRQRLRRWWCPPGQPVPPAGHGLTGPAGRPLGRITTVVPWRGGAVGLSMVRREALDQPELEGLQLSSPSSH